MTGVSVTRSQRAISSSSGTIPAATSAQEPGGAPSGFEDDRSADSLRASVRAYVDRVRGGDLGALPAVLGIVVLGLLFFALRPETFLTPRNMANLADQAAPIIILAMGLVVLLIVLAVRPQGLFGKTAIKKV